MVRMGSGDIEHIKYESVWRNETSLFVRSLSLNPDRATIRQAAFTSI